MRRTQNHHNIIKTVLAAVLVFALALSASVGYAAGSSTTAGSTTASTTAESSTAAETTSKIPTDHWVSSYSDIVNTSKGLHEVFPESYWEMLDALCEKYPNWSFQAFYTGLNWEECFDGSYTKWDAAGESELKVERNLLQSDYWPSSWYSTEITGAFNWAKNSWTVYSAPNWIQASEEAIRYCMDPRNFLTEEQIFQFEDQTIYAASVEEVENVFKKEGSGYWTKDASKSDIYSTYSKKNLTYAEAVYEIGKRIGMNPVILASRIIQEQGSGTSGLISGTQTFTVTSGADKGKVVNGGYYNYFNMEATDGGETADYTIILNNGLTEAYKNGWNSRYAALYGGAVKFRNSYVSQQQNTFYTQKFCVTSDSKYCFWKQYMQSLTTPQSEARSAYTGYKNANTLSSTRTFVIPVYMEMPEEAVEKPTKDGNPNYKLGSIYVDGTSLSGFSTDKTSYSMNVEPSQTTIHINVHAYAGTSTISVSGKSAKGDLVADLNVMVGDNTYKIVCTAENGDKRTYTLKVHRNGEIVYGDINCDGVWDVSDIAIIGSHIIGKITLTGERLETADINGDGEADIVDIAFIGAYIIGKIESVPQRQ